MPRRPRAANVTEDSSRSGVWWCAAVIILAGVVSYANSLSGPLVLDDEETIVLNDQIRRLWPPSVVLFPAKELPVAGRPVANLSFALNYAIGGLDVQGYHVVNIAIHVACALLLFGIVRRTLAGPKDPAAINLAFASALIWLVHPLQTDAVDYITERTELLMGLCYLLTLYASIRGQSRPTWLAVAVGACLLGMGSKESMATAPPMIVLYDRIFVFHSLNEAWRARGRFYVSLAATWLLLAALLWPGPRSRSTGFSTGVSPWVYLLNQTVMIAHYLRLAIWPRGLALIYGVPRALTLGEVVPYAALLTVLAALTVLALVVRPKIGFLGAWFFITLAPASSIVPIATEVGAERRMYLPLASVVVVGVAGVAWLWDRTARLLADTTIGKVRLQRDATKKPLRGAGPPGVRSMAGFAVVSVVAATLAMETGLRNREYASGVSLARTTLRGWPSVRARHWLGAELVAAGQRDEGIAELRRVLPEDPSANYTLGLALFQAGKLDEAVPHLREFLAHESARIEVPAAHEMIGRALETQGSFAEAAGEFRQVLTMTPSNVEAHALLAESLLKQQKFDEAAVQYQQFLNARPTDLGALMNLGIAFAGAGRQDDSIAAFRRAVDINPQDGGAQRNLARALLGKGAFDEAASYARQAVRLRPDDPVALDELGLALAGQRKWEEAIIELRRSLQLDPNDAEVRDHLAAALRAKDGIIGPR